MSTLTGDLIDRHPSKHLCSASDESGDRGKARQAPIDGERNGQSHTDRDSAAPSEERRLTPNWFLRYWVPKRPWISKTPFINDGITRATRQKAVTEAVFIQTAPHSYQNLIIIDLDLEDAERYVLSRVYDDQDFPEPSFITTNPASGHAHVGFFIEGFVSSLRGKRALNEIARKMTVALGGDPAYSGLMMRNPLLTSWAQTWWGTSHRYSLRELASHPGISSQRIPSRGARSASGTPTDALGRNAALFNALRTWAYAARPGFTDERLWKSVCLERAIALNTSINGGDPLSLSEVKSVAASVSSWVWRKEQFSPEGFSRIQRARAEKAAHVRQSRDRWFQVLSAVELGHTQGEIAKREGITKDATKQLIRRAKKWREEFPHEFFETAADYPDSPFSIENAPVETPKVEHPPVRRFSYRASKAEALKVSGRHALAARRGSPAVGDEQFGCDIEWAS